MREDPNHLGGERWTKNDENLRPVAARTFSGRTVMLLLVIVIVVLPLAPTVHRYFNQQAEITALHQDIDRLQHEQGQLKSQAELWKNDNYVEQQARERLFYVKPGETPYVVTGRQDEKSEVADSSAEAVTAKDPNWGQTLWGSIASSGS